MIKRIHVDQHIIRRNRAEKTDDAPITIQTSKGSIKVYDLTIYGPSEVVYSPDKPLKCGAHVWIQTKSMVGFHGPQTLDEEVLA